MNSPTRVTHHSATVFDNTAISDHYGQQAIIHHQELKWDPIHSTWNQGQEAHKHCASKPSTLREVWRFQNYEIPLKIPFRNFKETYKWIYRQVIRVVETYDVGKPTKRNNPSRSRDVYFTLNVCFQTSQPTEELRTSERKKERGLPEITVIGYWNNSQSAEKLVAARFDDTVRSDSNCVRKQENRSFYKITIQQQENDVQLPSSYT